jgi:hypothetical protein
LLSVLLKLQARLESKKSRRMSAHSPAFS